MPLQLDDVGDSVRVTLDFPPVNAFDIDAIASLEQCFAGHRDGRPMIITGAGRVFSAGVDTKAFMAYSPDERKTLFRGITRMVAALCAIPSPVIAAVNGHALGGGLAITLGADYRIVAEGEHKFGLTEAKAGVPFPKGPTALVLAELPGPLRRHLTLSSRVVSGAVLHQHLVFDEMVSSERLAAVAAERAAEIAAQPAFAQVKVQMRGALQAELAKLASME